STENRMSLATAIAEAREPALELRGISKRFPGVLALDGVSLTIRRGEIHAIIGQHGAGKSTMINIISGMTRAASGTALLAGKPAAIFSPPAGNALAIATVHPVTRLP